MAVGIQDKIDKLGKYFLGFNIGSTNDGKQVVYLEVVFPQGWGVSSLIKEKFGVNSAKGSKQNSYYFFASLLDVGIDAVFDAASFNIKANEEAQEKKNFLAEKVKELQKLVTENDMSKLKQLEFKFVPRRKEIKPSKQEEKKVDNTETVNEDDVA